LTGHTHSADFAGDLFDGTGHTVIVQKRSRQMDVTQEIQRLSPFRQGQLQNIFYTWDQLHAWTREISVIVS